MPLAIELATPADDPAIRRLLRCAAMPGRIRLTYEREPDFRPGCEVTGDECQVLVARADDSPEVVGLACRSARNVFVNGVERRMGYLGQLRIHPSFRGRWLLSRGFSRLKELHDQDPLPGYLTTIVGGNHEAAGVLIEKRRKVFPVYQRVADYRTLAIDVSRRKAPWEGDIRISTAESVGLAAVADFLRRHGASRQFYPVWSEASLAGLSALGLSLEDLKIAWRGGEMVGVAGLWDQSGFKQTVVQGYEGWLRIAAPFYNLAAPLLGRATLPRPGEKLRSAYAALICIAKDEVAVFQALLRDLYNAARSRNMSHLLVGLDARDPLLPAASEYLHITYPSCLYLVEWPGGVGVYDQLDGRATYLDIACL